MEKQVPKPEIENSIFDELSSYFKSGIIDWDKVGAHIEILISIIVPILLVIILKLNKYLVYKNIGKKLHPYYSKLDIKIAKRYYVNTKGQEKDPANEIKFYNSNSLTIKEDLYSFFVNKVLKSEDNDNRFYLILADAGMGKSTFMLNLYRKYYRRLPSFLSNSQLKLFPLGENFDELMGLIEKITDKENTVLLLDALDESPYFNSYLDFTERFDQLIQNVKSFKHVIITCRTQFFSNESDEPFELKIKRYKTLEGNGFYKIKKMYISPFDQDDIETFLGKKYNFYHGKKKKLAKKLISQTNDLLFRPMLLSRIDELNNLSYLSSKISVYFEIINSWLDRESNKYGIREKRIFKNNLFKFSLKISEVIYNNYAQNGLYISLVQAEKIASELKINLTNLEIKSRSLLNRNTNGDYKFSHKSILEFFISINAIRDSRIKSYYSEEFQITYDFENFDFSKRLFEELAIIFKICDIKILNGFVDNILEYDDFKENLYNNIIIDNNLVLWFDKRKYSVVNYNDVLKNIDFETFYTGLDEIVLSYFEIDDKKILNTNFLYRITFDQTGFNVDIYKSVNKDIIDVYNEIAESIRLLAIKCQIIKMSKVEETRLISKSFVSDIKTKNFDEKVYTYMRFNFDEIF